MTGEAGVVVVGGGIGGLATAVALKRAGVAARVLERMPSPSIEGAGVQLWFNGAAAVDELGVGEDVRARGVELARQRFVTPAGAVLAEIPVGAIAARLGIRPPVSIARADLLAALASELDPAEIEYGSTYVRVAQRDGDVAVELAEGGERRAAVVVGADGIDSTIRRDVASAEQVPAGYHYLRAVCDEPPGLERDVLHVALGPGGRLGTVGLGGGRRAVFASIAGARGAGEPAARLRGLAAAFAFPFPQLADALSGAEVAVTPIADIDPLPRWSRGRLVLTGDAAHAATPNEGRGASEALVDATVLAHHLAKADLECAGDVVEALQAFEAERKPETSAMQRRSRRTGKVLAMTSPLANRVRSAAVKHVLHRRMVCAIEREFGG